MNEAIDEIRRICRNNKIIGLYDAEKVVRKEMNNRLDYDKVTMKDMTVALMLG